MQMLSKLDLTAEMWDAISSKTKRTSDKTTKGK
jgi:hypothetical protein